ncbi:unnamed protein product [Ceratitis capitata]|uniref:RNA exonuclease 4 n=1 Tax=Ceratitis capitata TaxID=7213 RepID=A0A811UYS2_CERCA|nr:unnamed protein product [Ceratitis capitata]
MPQQHNKPQQQTNQNANITCSKKKRNQQNQKMQDKECAGDGGSIKQKQQHSDCHAMKAKKPLQQTADHCNKTTNKGQPTIVGMCMEQLQRQMQSMLSCNEAKENPKVCRSRKNSGSQWGSRQNSLDQQHETNHNTTHDQHPDSENRPLSKSARLRRRRKAAQRNKYVAIDCEMVGVGHNGQDDMLARVSIVNRNGEVLLDKFVKPWLKVIDYRTSVSGIRPADIEDGENFNDVQDEVVELLQGKILVGHAIRNDLAVLHIKHPYKNIRDTARYKPLCRLVSNGRTPSLKLLSQSILGMEIQTGEHNSVEDARAAMKIYNHLSSEWEKYLQKQQGQHK